jgi:hypothetical protein
MKKLVRLAAHTLRGNFRTLERKVFCVMAVSFVFLEFNLFYQGGTRLGSYFGEHLDGVKIEPLPTASG